MSDSENPSSQPPRATRPLPRRTPASLSPNPTPAPLPDSAAQNSLFPHVYQPSPAHTDVNHELLEIPLSPLPSITPGLPPSPSIVLRPMGAEREDDMEAPFGDDPLNQESRLPSGWKKYVHLDGSLYYRHDGMGLITPTEINEVGSAELMKRVWSSGLTEKLPGDWELVATEFSPDRVLGADIYFSCGNRQEIWMCFEECGCPKPFHEPSRCPTPRQELRKEPKYRFWDHVAAYPMHLVSLPPYWEGEFIKALTHGANERILDERKTMFPFTDEQARRFIQVYHDLRSAPKSQGQLSTVPALAWHVARVMAKIEAVRERYHYGTKEARLYRDIAIPSPTLRTKAIDGLLSGLMFGAHKMYRERLEQTRPKGYVYLPDFQELMRSLLVEWSDANLLATVFVSANVAFLAVPNLNSLQRTASLASTLLSMLSIVIGVHHVWRHRRRVDAEEPKARQYLRCNPTPRSLTLLSCTLALPIVTLLYAILAFTVAVAAFSIQDTSSVARVLLAVLLGALPFIAALVLAVFWDAWREPETQEPEEVGGQVVHKTLEKDRWMTRVGRQVMRAEKSVASGVRSAYGKIRAVQVRRGVKDDDSSDAASSEIQKGSNSGTTNV
ncbi:hypothetical protein BV25DRAFT_1914504 [Artomyces pyxidatus]|uniref:Uncharacterized protein n=1 Tax=Artomyces pyxidatus TaxID=48021 RepID=A0ACB8T611_9AGAM|nr:hypothetical protein BV25DRAFT_1914504 [Artomyces pyxidatus]